MVTVSNEIIAKSKSKSVSSEKNTGWGEPARLISINKGVICCLKTWAILSYNILSDEKMSFNSKFCSCD